MSNQPADDAMLLILALGGALVLGLMSIAQYFGSSCTSLPSLIVAGGIMFSQLAIAGGAVATIGAVLNGVFRSVGRYTTYFFAGGAILLTLGLLVEGELWPLAQNYECIKGLWAWWTLW